MILSLGSANFSGTYGLSSESRNNLDFPALAMQFNELNLEHMDTASSYGNAEKVIGDFWVNLSHLKITSKLHSRRCTSVKEILLSVEESMNDLKISGLWGLLLHDFPQVNIEMVDHIRSALEYLVSSGKVKYFGASVYSQEEVKLVKSFFPQANLFQFPENVCDRRSFGSKYLRENSEKGDLFFVRSIFLQGLLLRRQGPYQLNLKRAIPKLEQFFNHCDKLQLSPQQVCMDYVKQIPWASGLVVGVDTPSQLTEISVLMQAEKLNINFNEFPQQDPWVSDPRNWS